MTDEELRAIVADYEQGEIGRTRRDAAFRQAAAQGRSQADIIRATGYSRETIRQALNPQIRETLNARRRRPAP